MRAAPPSGGRRVARIRKRVLLPPPFGPRKPNSSPRATVNDTPASASRAPKRRRRSMTSIAGVPPAGVAAPRPGPRSAGSEAVQRGRRRSRGTSRRGGVLAVEKDPRPDLEVEEDPHLHEGTVASGQVVPPALLDDRGVEEATGPGARAEEQVFGERPALGTEPPIEGQRETVLRTVEDHVGHQAGGRAPE